MNSASVAPEEVAPEEVAPEEVEIPIAILVEPDIHVNENAIVVYNNSVAIDISRENDAIVISPDNVSVIPGQMVTKQYVCCCSENMYLGLTLAIACGYVMAIVNYAINEGGVQDGTTAILAIVGIANVSGMVWLKFQYTYEARVPVSVPLRGGGDVKVYDVKFSFEVDQNFNPTKQKFQVILFNGIEKGFTVEKEETLDEITKNKTYKIVGSDNDNIEKFKESIKNKIFSATLSNGNIIGKKMPTGVGGKRRRRRSLQKNKRKRNKKTRRKYNTLSKN
jgi:hypothetical protein